MPGSQPYLSYSNLSLKKTDYLGGMYQWCIAFIVDQIRINRVQAHELLDYSVITQSTKNCQNCVTIFVSPINAVLLLE